MYEKVKVKFVAFFIHLTLIFFIVTKPLAGSVFESAILNLSENEYDQLPQHFMQFRDLYEFGENVILRNAVRTLESQKDFLPPFKKIVHANGVCLSGQWKMSHQLKYSGLFKSGTIRPIIARVSSAFNATKKGDYRAFGLAGKVFSKDYLENQKGHSSNFFMVDDLGGTKIDQFAKTELSNMPKISKTWEIVKNLLFAVKVALSFKKADSHPEVRQLYELSEVDLVKGESVKTPQHIKAVISDKMLLNQESDFRDEVTQMVYDNKELIFNIMVKESNSWKFMGEMIFNRSYLSPACDHELHFHHPKFRP